MSADAHRAKAETTGTIENWEDMEPVTDFRVRFHVPGSGSTTHCRSYLIMIVASADLPTISGAYIASPEAPAAVNVPAVVARARYVSS